MPGRFSSRRRQVDIWPGFVDALASLLLVITFVLVVFVLSQFYLRGTVSEQNEALKRLTQQVSELADLLSLEREASADPDLKGFVDS
jgi:chemotaxis protein MotB